MKMQRNNEFKCEERWGIMQNRHSSHTCSVLYVFIPHKLQGYLRIQGNCVNFKYSTLKRCRGAAVNKPHVSDGQAALRGR